MIPHIPSHVVAPSHAITCHHMPSHAITFLYPTGTLYEFNMVALVTSITSFAVLLGASSVFVDTVAPYLLPDFRQVWLTLRVYT